MCFSSVVWEVRLKIDQTDVSQPHGAWPAGLFGLISSIFVTRSAGNGRSTGFPRLPAPPCPCGLGGIIPSMIVVAGSVFCRRGALVTVDTSRGPPPVLEGCVIGARKVPIQQARLVPLHVDACSQKHKSKIQKGQLHASLVAGSSPVALSPSLTLLASIAYISDFAN